MLMGNTGTGKSSVGNRLLGFGPTAKNKPFVVAGTGKSVTLAVETKKGTWFADKEFPELAVVDTPGPCRSGLLENAASKLDSRLI